jgi:EmrB/QacA subfamily drug resistance transporter
VEAIIPFDEADAAAAAVTPDLTHRQLLVVFSGLMAGMLLAGLDGTVVATAMPTIVGELGGLDHLSWVVTAYLLSATVSTPLYGKLGDLFGRKHLFQVAICIFLLGSVLSGLSRSMLELIAFRALQGLGAGGLLVLAQAIIGDLVSPRERGRYQGYFGALFGVSSVAGPLLGGFFTDQLSWRWVFYVNLPVGIVALVVTSLVLPESVRRAQPRLDYAGAVVLTGAVAALVLMTTWGGSQYRWSSPTILGLGAGAVSLFTAFVVVERRAAEPIIPLQLFRVPNFAVSGVVSLFVGVALFGSISFLPMFLQVVTGASATDSGLLLAPLMLGMLGASMAAGRTVSRTGRYKRFPVTGLAVASAGMFLLSTIDAATSRTQVSAFMVVLGIGIGLTMQVLVLAVQNAVSRGDLGVATSTVNFCRSIGGCIGVALFGAVFTTRLAAGLADRLPPGTDVPTGRGLSVEALNALPPAAHAGAVTAFADALGTVFLCGLPVVVIGFVLVTRLRELPLREQRQSRSVPLPAAETAA